MGIDRAVSSSIGVLALVMAHACLAQPEDEGALSSEQMLGHPEVRGALAAIDARIEGVLIYEEVPGISVGIVHDQDLIRSGGYGHSVPALTSSGLSTLVVSLLQQVLLHWSATSPNSPAVIPAQVSARDVSDAVY